MEEIAAIRRGAAAVRSHWTVLAGVAVFGLVLRFIVLTQTSSIELRIVDEMQYAQLATSLVGGDGFAWRQGQPTSLRPPLYPGLMAMVWSVTGPGNLQAVRFVQIVLSLLTAVLVYNLARRAFDPIVAAVAASVTWLYPSLIFLNFTILTETLFTFLLLAFVRLAILLIDRDRRDIALATGALLGLGALTRSVLWPVPVVLCPLLIVLLRGSLGHRLRLSALVLAGYAVVVTPWAIRNTQVQGVVTIVDTMGGLNLRVGNYEHTPDDRMWDAVSLTGEQSWIKGFSGEDGQVVTEGHKDKWAQRQAIEYMRAHPWTTARRALIKFADLWGLEREFVAGMQHGLYALPLWFVGTATVVVLVSYVVVALAAGAGIWLAPPDWRTHVLLLLPVGVITAAHMLAFGHSRYHLPLVPILAMYAAALWRLGARHALGTSRLRRYGALGTVGILLLVWMRQAFVDASRVRALLERFF